MIHSAHKCERVLRKGDMVVTECTVEWEPDRFHRAMTSHTGSCVQLNGPPVGDYMRRLRTVSNLDRDETVFL